MNLDFLDARYWGNTAGDWLIAALTFAGALVAFLAVRSLIIRRLKALAERTSTDIDDLAVTLLGKIRFPEAFIVAFWVASRPLKLPLWADRGLHFVMLVAVVYRAITIIQGIAAYSLERAVLKDDSTISQRNAARNLTYLSNALIWVGGVLFVLSNLGVNITSFVAGLGIGGVAVALAAQAVLGDLFSAVAIYLDKPFVVGDAITVDNLTGTIENIGIKTTRVRALSGELLIFPNSNLTSSRVKNWQDLSERRVVLKFSASCSTSPEKLAAVPPLLKQAVAAQKLCRFERAHLSGLGDWSVDFELVYYCVDGDFNKHMDAQQEIILFVLRAFQKEGIEIPFPTRTLVQR
jgi:small-conductance mechanosensitive channel